MIIKFCGAARSVTGSCHMMEFGEKKILVDCGMRQGTDKKTELGEGEFPFVPAEIDMVLLTHAHIDHSGLLPLLIKRGFTGKILATHATAELAGIMLPDSGHIQEQEAEYQSRKNLRAGKPEVAPLYDVQDALDTLRAFRPVSYNEIVEVVPDMRARFVDAGHLLGSAAIEVWATEGGKTLKIVFSGDIGRNNRPILQDPQPIDEADYVLMEGTYGDRDHEVSEAADKEAELAALLREGMARGGNIVIPSFAIGRTQELLYYIKKLLVHNAVPGLERIPVYVDSPLGISATQVYERSAQGYYDEEALEMAKSGSPFDFPSLRVSQTAQESKQINFQPGCNIIISSSGMCDAGRILHHLKHNLYRSDSTVIFTGYQAGGTLGRLLLDGAAKVKLFGEEIKVNAAIKKAEGFSGHAGKSELIDWLGEISPKPRRVFLIHGEAETLESFSHTLTDLGYTTAIPAFLSQVQLTYEGEEELPALTPEAPESADTFAPRALSAIIRQWKLNGAISIRKDDRPILETAYGFANMQDKPLNSLHTRFALGEITALFTASLAFILAREGTLSLNDALSLYVPEYAHAKGISLGELLFMERIAPDYIENAFLGRAEARIREEKLSAAEAQKARFAAAGQRIADAAFIEILNALPEPGAAEEQGAHSNFRLLGMALERAAGMPLSALMRRWIFAPLAMEETELGGLVEADYSEIIKGRSVSLGQPEGDGGDAGATGSAFDLIRFLEAIRTGALLGEADTQRFFDAREGKSACGLKRNYGWYSAFAGFEGWRSAVYVSPKRGVSFAVLVNAPAADPAGLPEVDETGAHTLAQRLRRELDAIYLVCDKPMLEPVDEANFSEALRLRVAPAQEHFVADNAYSLAQAYAMRDMALPYVVVQDDVPVGFVMLYINQAKGEYGIWRFMVDARFQNKGFGAAALALALAKLQALGAKTACLSVVPGNEAAVRLYEDAGFRFTGKVEADEAYMELTL